MSFFNNEFYPNFSPNTCLSNQLLPFQHPLVFYLNHISILKVHNHLKSLHYHHKIPPIHLTKILVKMLKLKKFLLLNQSSKIWWVKSHPSSLLVSSAIYTAWNTPKIKMDLVLKTLMPRELLSIMFASRLMRLMTNSWMRSMPDFILLNI